MLRKPWIKKFFWIDFTGLGRGRKKPIKIQGDSYSFDIAEPEYDNQIALSSTKVKEKGLNSKPCS